MKALELGAVEILIVWENLEINRVTLKKSSGEELILHVNKEQEKNRDIFMDSETAQEMEIVQRQSLLEWFTEKYKEFGATLEFITNRSQEGSQFVKGFGGIGGLLRYKVDFDQMNFDSDEFLSD